MASPRHRGCLIRRWESFLLICKFLFLNVLQNHAYSAKNRRSNWMKSSKTSPARRFTISRRAIRRGWVPQARPFKLSCSAVSNVLPARLLRPRWKRFNGNSESVQEALWEDVQLAYQLDINATPTVFINGRRVGAFDESVLNFLIQNELKSASR